MAPTLLEALFSHTTLACTDLILCSIPSLTTHVDKHKVPFGLSENNIIHRRPRVSSTLLEQGGQEKEYSQH